MERYIQLDNKYLFEFILNKIAQKLIFFFNFVSYMCYIQLLYVPTLILVVTTIRCILLNYDLFFIYLFICTEIIKLIFLFLLLSNEFQKIMCFYIAQFIRYTFGLRFYQKSSTIKIITVLVNLRQYLYSDHCL